MTYAALQRTAVHAIAIQLTDGHGGILVRIHLDEGEAAVGLEPRLDHETKILKQRYEIILGGVGRQVADVAGGLPLWRLLHHHVEALGTMGGEMMVSVRGGGSHAHSGHLGLLRHRGLTLLIGPVAANGPGSKPFAVHGAQRLLGIRAIAKGHKTVTTGATGLHVPHDPCFGDGAKGGKGLQENLVVDLVGQVTHEDVEVIGGIFFVLAVGLIGPIDANLLRELISGTGLDR